MKRKRCFIYCRQSSGQEEVGQSLSIQQQLTNCRNYAKAGGFEIAGEFSDANISGKTYPAGPLFESIAGHDPGFRDWYAQQSGQKKFRPGLGALMARLEEVEYLVLDDITRLHRSAAKSFLEQTLNYYIIKADVKILQVKGASIDLSQFDQQLIQMLRTQINDEQIRNQKLKSMESRRKLKDSGVYVGSHLWGCVYDGKNGNRFDPEKAAVIRELNRLIVSGETFYRICRIMNEKHLACFRPAKCFYPATLRHIASNPVYAGLMYDSRGELIPCRNVEDPPLTPDEFFRAREILRRHAGQYGKQEKTQAHFLPFRGLLHCGVCGARLTLCYDRGRIFYYCRTGVLTHSQECAEVRIYTGKREGRAAGGTCLFTALGVLLEGLRQAHPGGGNFRSAEDELRRLRKKLRVAYSQFCEDVLDEQSYREITSHVMLRCQKLEDGLRRSTSFPAGGPPQERLLQKLLPYPDRLTERQKNEYRACLRHFIRDIIIYQDRVRIVLEDFRLDLPRENASPKRRFMPRGILRRKGEAQWELCYIYNIGFKTEKRVKAAELGNLTVFLKGLPLEER